MKIGDVQIGKEYGALDKPRSNYGVDPRQVKVLEIVTEEEGTWNRYTGARETKKVKRVKVEVLNGATKRVENWRWDKIQRAAKGDTLVIEARQLVGPWAALAKDIKARIDREEKRLAREEDLKRRFKALGFKCDWGSAYITVRDNRVEVEFRDSAVEKLLTMLEASRGA